ncbi:MAG: ABC transporter substrate-binding protein, partial [Betaproteobacteria bacterium]|nr:ABC transporter substrate-binding protein [Betaproteobacteria bacterium]
MESKPFDRRQFLKTAAGSAGVAAAALHAPFVIAQPAKIKVGLMLPHTGTFALYGAAIQNGFRLYVAAKGGKIAGREVEYVNLDDESDPAKAADNAGRLVNRDKVDVLVGTVHSGVQMGMIKIARESGVLMI